MGSSSTKFRKHIQSGDEYAALHLYSSSSDLRKALDPNVSYGDSYSHDTPMHVVARHAMKSLLRIFLFDLGGNPNKKNARNETVLHCVCAGGVNDKTLPQKLRRGECILLCLQWRGTKLPNGSIECIDLTAADESENTALHYTAMSGLQQSVELLVAYGSPLFVENAAKETPCDCAEKSGHSQIALYLESKMVFSNEDQTADELGVLMSQLENEEGYSGLRAQDLQEAKDQLLVETSDMLHVPLFTAEALLRNHEWSREMLLEAWIENPVACCEKCGVIPPATLMSDELMHRSETITSSSTAVQSMVDEEMCEICACVIPSSEEPVSMTCEHHFCRCCWQTYLTGKIIEGETHHITCPGYECTRLVPVDLIENLVSREMARRYLQFDIKAFVESNPMIKWCPYPGCGRAVRLPDSDNPMSPLFRSGASVHSPIDTSHAVDCGNGHIFCWECLGEAHEPASCENWNNWHKKISDIKPEELNGTEEETESSANCLWLITNSKACPNCKSPIQKNEGCNHMKCSKCKFDFCWVCLEAWKKHSTATGGYFRCNRYEIVKKVEESHDNLKSEAEVRNKKMQELNRFVHYYSRFKNHENSYKLETALYDTAKEKMLILARAVSDSRETAMRETKFVQDAITQLLKARHVLKCSYVYGYFLDDVGYKKPIFEFMQTELEECTEALSEMIARPYLHTPRTKIVQTAHLVQRKRHELVAAIAKGLVPPDTSPATQKKKTYRVDEDTRKALLASLQDESFNLWVRDVSSGRHPNIPPVLNWPEASDESDSETSPSRIETAASLRSTGGNDVVDLSDSDLQMPGFAGLGICSRNSCFQRRAVNQLTGQVLDYCSIECMRVDRAGETVDYQRDENAVFGQNDMSELINDYQLDLLRALEMSRLQFLREIGSLRPGIGESLSPSDSSPMPSPRSSMSPTTKLRARSTNDADAADSRHLVSGVSGSSLDRAAATAAAVSRSLAASPRLSMSSVEFETIPTTSAPTTDLRSRRTLDQELTRALEISQLNLHDEERDMCLAIALSIQDTAGSAPQLSNIAVQRPHETVTLPAAHCHTAGPFGFAGTINTRTPSEQTRESNTVRSQAPGCCMQTMPCMGLSSLRGASCLDRSTASLSRHPRRSDMCCTNSHFDYNFPRQSTPVSSAVSSASTPLVVENVFEPRPPHPTFTLPAAVTTVFPVERCALAHDETVTVLDPWRRRPSSLDHGRPNLRCVRSSICCESVKCGNVARRRRSCGTRLPHHHDHAVADCSVVSTPTGGILGAALSTNPSVSSDELSAESGRELRHASIRQQDSIDLVISSEILESMLQGTAGYVVSEAEDSPVVSGWNDCRHPGQPMTKTVEVSPAPVENDARMLQEDFVKQSQSDDNDAVFV